MDDKTTARVICGFAPKDRQDELEQLFILADAGLLEGGYAKLRKEYGDEAFQKTKKFFEEAHRTVYALPKAAPKPAPARCFRTTILPFDW